MSRDNNLISNNNLFILFIETQKFFIPNIEDEKMMIASQDNLSKASFMKNWAQAGIVAHLEDKRDEKLAKLLTGLQAQVRWYYQQVRFSSANS